MGTFFLSNSFCLADGFTEGESSTFKNCLTYDNVEVLMQIIQLKKQLSFAIMRKNRRQIGWVKHQLKNLDAQKKICWYRDGVFPTGHLEILTKTAIENGILFEIEDHRTLPEPSVQYVWRNRLEPRLYQAEMINLAKTTHRGVFESAVGTGKSLIMQNVIYQAGVPALIILPSKDLVTQTVDGIKAAMGTRVVEAITTARAKSAKRIPPIRAVTIQTLASLKKNGLLERILEDVGMVCVDEVHHAGASSYVQLLNDFSDIYYRYGFSGTFLRNDSKTLDMWGFLSHVIYRYPASKATAEGFLTPLEIVVHQIDGVAGQNYQKEYTKNYCKNSDLIDKIKDILNFYAKDTEQVLILVGRKDGGGSSIHKALQQEGYDSVFISGDDKKDVVKNALKAFNDKKLQILIGSSIIGEGIDIRSTDHLIMAQGGKSEIAITQAVGRAVRLYPGKSTAYVHDFKFTDTKYLEKHFEQRFDIYKRNFSAKGE